MTERFVYYTHKDHDYILDTPHTHLDFIEMLGDALSTEEIVDLLNKQNLRINELEERIQELEESLGFCRDLLDGTCNSTRMKQLHETLKDMVKQSTTDNGRYKVWQVPPIKEGTRITTTTSEVKLDD